MHLDLRDSERLILQVVRRKKLISRAAIARETKLSKPVVSEGVARLLDKGILMEVKKGKSSNRGGKRPVLLSFRPDFRYIVGLDVGGTNTRAVLTDLEGRVIEKKFSKTGTLRSEAEFFSKCVDMIDSVISVPKMRILGIGVGIPGTVDPETGYIYNMPALGLKDVNLKEFLEKHYDLDVFLANDVTLNALGELWQGAAKNKRNVLLVSIGTGLGAGLIINRELYEGTHGMAGEMGFTVTDWSEEKKLKFEFFGALENWISGYGLGKKLKEEGFELPVEEFFQLIDEHERFNRIFMEACEHLALALANAILLLDPDMVVIAGGIGFNHYERIMSVVTPVLEKVVMPELLNKVRFARAELGELGVALGAAGWVLMRSFIGVY
ncbi:MAG: hypothetical protein PWP09_307 [Thermotogota bacterium]|nr:hypothetical protein [Thermotogota bacterium]